MPGRIYILSVYKDSDKSKAIYNVNISQIDDYHKWRYARLQISSMS